MTGCARWFVNMIAVNAYLSKPCMLKLTTVIKQIKLFGLDAIKYLEQIDFCSIIILA